MEIPLGWGGMAVVGIEISVSVVGKIPVSVRKEISVLVVGNGNSSTEFEVGCGEVDGLINDVSDLGSMDMGWS
jgi:hypothetical protein